MLISQVRDRSRPTDSLKVYVAVSGTGIGEGRPVRAIQWVRIQVNVDSCGRTRLQSRRRTVEYWLD